LKLRVSAGTVVPANEKKNVQYSGQSELENVISIFFLTQHEHKRHRRSKRHREPCTTNLDSLVVARIFVQSLHSLHFLTSHRHF
jgi:hypothetical protein